MSPRLFREATLIVAIAVARIAAPISAQLPQPPIEPERLSLEQASEWLESNLGAMSTLGVDSLNFMVQTTDVSVRACHIRFTRQSSRSIPPGPRTIDVDLTTVFGLDPEWKWYPGPFPVGGPGVINLVWGRDEATWFATRSAADAAFLGSIIERAARLCGGRL